MTVEDVRTEPRSRFVYDEWMEGLGVPVHRGFAISDLRTVELGWWDQRGCNTAFVQLMGQEGVSETRITEIPPGETLPPYTVAVDEAVYVLAGSGLTSVSVAVGGPTQTFEWSTRAMFLVPGNTTRQFSNLSGETPVRLVHYSYLPLAMSVVPDPGFFLDNPYARTAADVGISEGAWSEALDQRAARCRGRVLVRPALPRSARLGPTGLERRERGGRSNGAHAVRRLGHDRAHVGVRAADVQEGPPARARSGDPDPRW
jgi:hypothetical protein